MGHTVIQVPVPEIESIAQAHGLASVYPCPHITVLGPFVDRRDVDDELVSTLRGILAPMRAFDFALSAVGCFDDGLTYLAPRPAQPFLRLTQTFAAAFPQWPPYGGAFDGVVPHLSIGANLSVAEVAAVETLLPIRARAAEVTLTWWSEDAIEVLVRLPLSLSR